jgi:hypothetical protein
MSAQFNAALIRALIIGLVSAATTALTTWSTTDDGKTIAIAAGTAFLAPFLARFGGEGSFDTHRAEAGDVRPGDVGARPAPAPTPA